MSSWAVGNIYVVQCVAVREANVFWCNYVVLHVRRTIRLYLFASLLCTALEQNRKDLTDLSFVLCDDDSRSSDVGVGCMSALVAFEWQECQLGAVIGAIILKCIYEDENILGSYATIHF